MATTTSRPTNHRCSERESRVLASRLPTTTPIRLAMVNGITVAHSIEPACRRVASATAELMVITSKDVPTASDIVNPSANTSAGTITKPPPTPKNPVSRPTSVPAITTFTAVVMSTRVDVGARSGAAAAPTDLAAAGVFLTLRHIA